MQANKEQQLDISTNPVTFPAMNLNSIQSSETIRNKLILSAAPAEQWHGQHMFPQEEMLSVLSAFATVPKNRSSAK